jgi:hypothetical protein
MARILGNILRLGSDNIRLDFVSAWGMNIFGDSYVSYNGVTRTEKGHELSILLNTHFLPALNHYETMLNELVENRVQLSVVNDRGVMEAL